MLSKLFNLFKKQKPEEQQEEDESFLCYKIDNQGFVYVDINIRDSSEESISQFARLVSDMSSHRFHIDTMKAIMDGFEETGDPEIFDFFLAEVIKYSKDNLETLKKSLETTSNNAEDPCIKPSDVI